MDSGIFSENSRSDDRIKGVDSLDHKPEPQKKPNQKLNQDGSHSPNSDSRRIKIKLRQPKGNRDCSR